MICKNFHNSCRLNNTNTLLFLNLERAPTWADPELLEHSRLRMNRLYMLAEPINNLKVSHDICQLKIHSQKKPQCLTKVMIGALGLYYGGIKFGSSSTVTHLTEKAHNKKEQQWAVVTSPFSIH